jgi:hypothetical protein
MGRKKAGAQKGNSSVRKPLLVWAGRHSFLLCGVLLVQLADLGFLRIAFMENKPVAQRKALSVGDRKIAGAGRLAVFEIVDAERIGGDEAVLPGVPPCRMARILGMIENRHANGLALDLRPVIDPVRALRPNLSPAYALAVDRLSVGRRHPCLGVVHQL